jgi:hypothetical protein
MALAISSHQDEQVETLMKTYRDLTQPYTGKAMTPISHALFTEQPSILTTLLRSKPDLNSYRSTLGNTFLHEAIAGDGTFLTFTQYSVMRIRNVLLLLRHGADPDLPNGAGISAREILREKGMDIDGVYLRVKAPLKKIEQPLPTTPSIQTVRQYA